MESRYERQVRFFGKEGQHHLQNTKVSVVGVGGLGCHVVQQLILLGVGHLNLIDSEELADTDRNRNVCARRDDPVPGTKKVEIAGRLAKSINPNIEIALIHDTFISAEAFASIKSSTHVFGCLDSEGARLILNELCSAYELKYIDLASDIIQGQTIEYGGRVCINWAGDGCLFCLKLLDLGEAQEDLSTEGERLDRQALYGLEPELLNRSGPSVVSINGVIASLGVTEFMLGVSGIRDPKRLIYYKGGRGVTISNDLPQSHCYYCKGIRGTGRKADVERYLKSGVGEHLR